MEDESSTVFIAKDSPEPAKKGGGGRLREKQSDLSAIVSETW